jgi:hypothetical protein
LAITSSTGGAHVMLRRCWGSVDHQLARGRPRHLRGYGTLPRNALSTSAGFSLSILVAPSRVHAAPEPSITRGAGGWTGAMFGLRYMTLQEHSRPGWANRTLPERARPTLNWSTEVTGHKRCPGSRVSVQCANLPGMSDDLALREARDRRIGLRGNCGEVHGSDLFRRAAEPAQAVSGDISRR